MNWAMGVFWGAVIAASYLLAAMAAFGVVRTLWVGLESLALRPTVRALAATVGCFVLAYLFRHTVAGLSPETRESAQVMAYIWLPVLAWMAIAPFLRPRPPKP